MAFIGILMVNIVFFIIVICVIGGTLFTGIGSIIAGTVLRKNERYNKLGTGIRIFGYIVTIPLVTLSGIIVWWLLYANVI